MNRTRIAGVMTASTALALVTAVPASAHEAPATQGAQGTNLKYGPVFDRHAAFQALATRELDELLAKATAAHARAAAVPNATVLKGKSRAAAVREYTRAVMLDKALGTLTGLSTDQAVEVKAIQAQLASAAADLRALLANHAAVLTPSAPVKVVQSDRVITATDPRALRGDCDGRHDGDQNDDRNNRTGVRGADFHHRSGGHDGRGHRS